MSNKPDYKIIAKSVEEFKEIEAKILALGPVMVNQIETAGKSFETVNVKLQRVYRDKLSLAVPSGITQLTTKGDVVSFCIPGVNFTYVGLDEHTEVDYMFIFPKETK